MNPRPDRYSTNSQAAATDADSLATRSSLLGRLRDLDDDASWRVFFDTYWRLIYNVALKSGLSDDAAQEVVQETVIAVARKMPDFRYDPTKGFFKQWLLLITRRRIHDQLRLFYRSESRSNSGQTDPVVRRASLPDDTPPPDVIIESVWDQEWRDYIFQAALARVRQQAKPKQFQVFDCCVLQNIPPGHVARMLGLSAAQVYLAKHRVSAAVKRAASEIEAEMGGAAAD